MSALRSARHVQEPVATPCRGKAAKVAGLEAWSSFPISIIIYVYGIRTISEVKDSCQFAANAPPYWQRILHPRKAQREEAKKKTSAEATASKRALKSSSSSKATLKSSSSKATKVEAEGWSYEDAETYGWSGYGYESEGDYGWAWYGDEKGWASYQNEKAWAETGDGCEEWQWWEEAPVKKPKKRSASGPKAKMLTEQPEPKRKSLKKETAECKKGDPQRKPKADRKRKEMASEENGLEDDGELPSEAPPAPSLAMTIHQVGFTPATCTRTPIAAPRPRA